MTITVMKLRSGADWAGDYAAGVVRVAFQGQAATC